MQQHLFGVLGVNIIHSALYYWQEPERLIDRLYDNLTKSEIEIDYLAFKGPAFRDSDPIKIGFRLVTEEATNAVIIRPDGRVVMPSDHLYKKPVLVQRARCQPITLAHTDIQRCALAEFRRQFTEEKKEIISLFELPAQSLLKDDEGNFIEDDFLQRVVMARTSGTDLLFSNYSRYFRLSGFLRRYTREPLAFAMGIEQLRELLDPATHTSLEGGMLEALGHHLHCYQILVDIYGVTRRQPDLIGIAMGKDYGT